ncbi:MAG: glycosyltransferase [Phycisphaerales bacterium]
MPPVVHLAHDWLVGMRGGERVLDRLAQQFGPTTIYTLVNDGRSLTTAIDACTVRTSWLQQWPGARSRLRRAYLPLMPLAVDRLRVQACDLLISTSSAVMKSIAAPNDVPHLCYCHSPARYVWEQRADYAHGRGGRVRSLGLRALSRRFQKWDVARAENVTHFLANSHHTAERIMRVYGRAADVVFPPVRTTFFTPDSSIEREDWYLAVGALEPYKRMDLAIQAALQGGLRLKVVGSGSQAKSLQQMISVSDRNVVEMLGRVDDLELRDLMRRARALIHPQQEDFGITAVEAQACGCPVIAYAGGGALDTVTDQTGVWFASQDVDALQDAVARFEREGRDSEACVAHAVRFSEYRFDEAMRESAGGLLGIALPATRADDAVTDAGSGRSLRPSSRDAAIIETLPSQHEADVKLKV